MDNYLDNFNLDIDRHTIRAVDEILAQVKKVKDRAGVTIFVNAVRQDLTYTSALNMGTPIAILTIGPSRVTRMSIEGVIVEKRVELYLDLIFKISTHSNSDGNTDIQAWADGLGDLVERYLQPYDPDMNFGMVRDDPAVTPWVWNWSSDTHFTQTLGRSFHQLDLTRFGLTGTAWLVPLQFAIDVWPWSKLTVPIGEPMLFTISSTTPIPAGDYSAMGGGAHAASASIAAGTVTQMPVAGTWSHATITGDANTTSSGETYALNVNGSDTAFTLTIPSGNSTVSDTTTTLATAAGDLVSWHKSSGSANAFAAEVISIEFAPS